MTPLIAAFVFVFGAIIGSFLNAVLWRLHTGESVAKGRSYCPQCRHPLSAHDLIPVLSWLALRGKCRYCAKEISPSYVVIELAVGALFALFAWKAFGAEQDITAVAFAGLLLQWYVVSALTVVFVFDHRYMLIPRSVTTWASVIAGAGGLALGASPLHMAAGAAVGYGVFWLQYVASKGRWIGGGDLHLGLLMGIVLGFPHVLVALFLAYVVGAVVGVVLLSGKRAGWGSEIPFGTFLSAATVVTMLWGDQILDWYLHLMLPL